MKKRKTDLLKGKNAQCLKFTQREERNIIPLGKVKNALNAFKRAKIHDNFCIQL